MGIVKDLMQSIDESGLSRIMRHTDDHETGAITAYRGKLSKTENQKRNRKLIAQLMLKGYGVTPIKGSYIENYGTPEAKEVGEETYFVVDLKNKGNLEKDLTELGFEYEQDSILVIPKGGQGAYLIGTNDAKYPGKGKKAKLGDRNLGQEGQEGQFVSKVKGRPFIFKEALKEYQGPDGAMGKSAVYIEANRKLTNN